MVLFRHLGGHALRRALFATLALLTVVAVIEFFDTAKIISGDQGTPKEAALFYLLQLPRQLSQVLPLGVLLGLLVAYGGLVGAREILAARAAGVGTGRLLLPALAVTVLFGAGGAALSQWVVPPADREADRLRVEVFKSFTWQWTQFYGGKRWFHAPGMFVHVEYSSADGRSLSKPLVFAYDEDFQLRSRVAAKRLQHQGDGRWLARDVVRTEYRPDGSLTRRQAAQEVLDLPASPDDLRLLRGRPYQLSLGELDEVITQRERQGQESRAYLLERQARFAAPFLLLVAALLALPVALAIGPGGSVVAGTARGLGLAFLVWAAVALLGALGRTGALSPVVAVWLPVLGFLLLGIGLLRRVRI